MDIPIRVVIYRYEETVTDRAFVVDCRFFLESGLSGWMSLIQRCPRNMSLVFSGDARDSEIAASSRVARLQIRDEIGRFARTWVGENYRHVIGSSE